MNCARCKYDLDGLAAGAVCPECGLAIEETVRRGRTMAPWARACWRAYRIGLGVAGAAYLVGFGLLVRSRKPGMMDEAGFALINFSLCLLLLHSLAGLAWIVRAGRSNRPSLLPVLSWACLVIAVIAGMLAPAKGYA